MSDIVCLCVCVSPQHPPNEAGTSAGPVSGSLQPHGHFQGPLQKTTVKERREWKERERERYVFKKPIHLIAAFIPFARCISVAIHNMVIVLNVRF